MKIAQKYSHLNGEEYLIVHHKKLYHEIINTIKSISADKFMTKQSKEKTMKGKMLYSPVDINKEFNKKFNAKNWHESRYQYYITTDPKLMNKLIVLPYTKQKDFLIKHGNKEPISSYKQTDFVKDRIAIEVQFGKYAFVAFDLFVKHLLFYSGGVINLGIEILPTKKMQLQMSSGVAYYEGEVYNVLRHGRNNPPVPLLILGIEQ
ncbi:restriction endonuclease [candidate division WWE3 bacterium CG06_land_8_20_14_3_00_42_16]|uniref:Restriction endonuclease n=4 Tax=Katanobacteria TaxID=422282 RepID=A0A2M7APP6_UNCKA|nr:MAG: restriction endonuclease [candidate division WWE3 bacterium CG06_land_8_20_14_3_00_42_16]PIZ42667.1 MAG: restriction endonuclease [candidate division WWE3 bacterium CG_4_10_14_0_2_um_filter_42_8]PJA37840.1 MAG: restriction endonuclease [candidate division WWE3 bacterium CG_4_9_14_3_um_filter_43_9]PJC69304.1 MAG: restriction endonuclease [candidate division WWE3 bacterium CG_4_8_14_3_um_filter_42_11]